MSHATNITMGRALACPDFEIMPIKTGMEAARQLPAGAITAVTCSPAQGIDGTVDFAARIAEFELRVIPHIAARRVTDQTHLDHILQRLDEAGIRDVFVISGDRTDQPGAFDSGLGLIRALSESGARINSIGVPCYPEGHSFIDTRTLESTLAAKAEHADYMVSQLCFNSRVILDWLRHTRHEAGIDLPIYIGVPGVMARTKLLSIALRIGIGDSVRFLRKNTGMLGGLLSGSKYQPDDLIDGLAESVADDDLNIAGLHINTFNQIEATEAWRHQKLDEWHEADAVGKVANTA